MRVKEKRISEIKKAEYNPRKISEKDKSHLKQSLERFGMVEPVVVNMHPERKNILVGGHQRLSIWSDLGHEFIPAVEVKLEEAEERELNIRLNNNQGSFDYDLLTQNFEVSDLISYGFEEYEFQQYMDDPVELPEKPKNIKRDDLVTFELKMKPEQKQAILEAIDAYKEISGVMLDGDALTDIVSRGRE